jgi:teichuronic acid biosynthesis glycosyltransferase TuaH
MKQRDIVVVTAQPWDIPIGSNCKNIAVEFAKQHRVLYVNAPLDRNTVMHRGKEELIMRRIEVVNGERPALVQVGDTMWNLTPDFIAESVNWIPVPFIHDVLNKRNNAKFAETIRKAMDQLGFRDVILFNDSLMLRGFYLKELLQPKLHIYYIRDNLVTQPYFRKQGKRLEPMLIAKSTSVVTNSLFLTEYAKPYNKRSYYVGQGCETDMFSPTEERPKPSEMQQVKGPVVGYVGFLTSMRLSISLIAAIARENKNQTIMLVGPEDDDFRNSELHQMENIIFTGPKDPAQLPAYVQHFDVCINPQEVNDLTIGNYPRKVDEYLAMGKPVVATYTRTMEIFKDHCYLASTDGEYVGLVRRAIEENNDAKVKQRIEFAKTHTWEKSVQQIYDAAF